VPPIAAPTPVDVEKLSRAFGEELAVDNVTLTVPSGAILGVIGPSGSGKTTLVRLLTGTLQPTSGTVRVLGEVPSAFRRQTRERIGYMPQHFVLYPDLTVQENLAFVASLFGMLWRQRRRREREVLQLLELWDVRRRRAQDLSGGMQKRLALATAMIHEPRLLFVDEPTAGLDPMLRQTIWSEFRRMRDAGVTLVVTTQYVGEAEYCDQVGVLARGRLIALAAPEDLRRDALGGDMIQVETTMAMDGAMLRDVPGVRSVRQSTPRTLVIVADDAGTATPRVLDAIRQQGVDVASSNEYRPSFDEVFAELVKTREKQTEEAEHLVARAA
jgi:ABC-2 type transport system ATP-binding protein